MKRRPTPDPAKLLKNLVAIPSVNPAFQAVDEPGSGEAAIIEFIEDLCRSHGLETRRQGLPGKRANLIAKLFPEGRVTQRVVLGPHLDTVGVTHARQWQPRVENGRLYGRGACDTKGSVACYLAALLQLAKAPGRPKHSEILFVGFADEEHNQLGSRSFAENFRKPIDLAIVGEPTKNRVVTAHKGDVWYRLTTQGRSAHGANPHLGKNAVYDMARVVTLLATTYAKTLSDRHHPLLGNPTINVGTIGGGRQPNIVPDQCEITIDRRMLPDESEAGIRRELTRLFNAHGLRVGIHAVRDAPCPALDTDPSHPHVNRFLQVCRQKKLYGVDYFCDASHLAAKDITSVVFGPGNIAQAHTENEWISLSSLEQATNQILRFLQGLE